MVTIATILKKYSGRVDFFDLELLIAHTINKPREFVLAHPEARIAPNHELRIKNYANRRMRGEPLAYILGHKEFFGLDFKVDNNTLVPRPETEMLVEQALRELTTNNKQLTIIMDVGTGSGNIIISLAETWTRNVQNRRHFVSFYATDISVKALKIAKYNAKKHGVDKKIKFLKGNLLEPILKPKSYNLKAKSYIILANLPYLSPAIYKSTMTDVKKYEPKSALLSPNHGLAHYEKLLKQILLLVTSYLPRRQAGELRVTSYFEISPEQKPKITKLIKKYFSIAKIEFKKDLAGKWRVCRIEI